MLRGSVGKSAKLGRWWSDRGAGKVKRRPFPPNGHGGIIPGKLLTISCEILYSNTLWDVNWVFYSSYKGKIRLEKYLFLRSLRWHVVQLN